MYLSRVLSELSSILYWMMLAACTVGPGTVVTCARAGAEFELSLVWALVFATALAFTLQEGTARLTIVSGMSLGQCLRVKYRHTAKLYNTAIICWVVAIMVSIGNTLYEANCFAGGIDAIMGIPGADQLEEQSAVGLRVGSCVGYAVIVLVLLYFDKTDVLGICLGVVMMGMVGLFLIVVFYMGLDMKKFLLGLLPNIPRKTERSAEPADIIISLVGTTSLGFNLFLGGAMARGKNLRTAQRGIALSVISALVVSTLILIVGAGFHHDNDDAKSFSISQLGVFIEKFVGQTGLVIFCVGFIAAALSSMLTVPLGAAITADTVFSEVGEQKVENDDNYADFQVDGDPNEQNFQMNLEDENANNPPKRLSWSVYFGIILIEVVFSTVIISLNVDRTMVILVAQTFNGCLLPFFSMCLLLCLNDPQFMSSAPQPGWANVFLVISVLITLFLAANVVIQKVAVNLATSVSARLVAGAVIAVGMMAALCSVTSLGKELLLSLKHGQKEGRANNSDDEN